MTTYRVLGAKVVVADMLSTSRITELSGIGVSYIY